MTQEERRRRAEAWRSASQDTAHAARALFREERHRSAVSRAYYAAYQAATVRSVLHGDEDQFPQGWNNPSHEQLPDLVMNLGGMDRAGRQRVKSRLRLLRSLRETADYRPGRSLQRAEALLAVRVMASALEDLGMEEV